MDVNLCRLPDEIRIMPKFLVPPYRHYVASAFDGQCRYSVKASEKTVYNKEKWTTKNSWHFTSPKIKRTSNATKFLYP